jgi:hypothetical protein
MDCSMPEPELVHHKDSQWQGLHMDYSMPEPELVHHKNLHW